MDNPLPRIKTQPSWAGVRLVSLRRLNLAHSYRSDDGPLVERFYEPCLSVATRYYRAVGYFTGQSLALAGKGLPTFAKRRGIMQLIAAPYLSDADRQRIQSGYRLREVLNEAILRALEPDSQIVQERLGYLGWLIAIQSLDLKLVYKDDDPGGIYHEKVGIFEDDDGNIVAFTGSANETVGGWYSNFESIDVFRSWVSGEDERVQAKVEAFKRLWGNETRGLTVLTFPDAARRKLISMAPKSLPESDVEVRMSQRDAQGNSGGVALPKGISLRPYQKEAINAWLGAGGRGVLSMATGTGKTLTAVAACLKMLERHGRLAMLVVAPYTHLAEQWAEELERCNAGGVFRAYGSRERWVGPVNQAIASFSMGVRDTIFAVTTNSTFATNVWRETVDKLTGPVVLVSDEMHYMGAPQQLRSLPTHVPYRLGLSATPSRWFDAEGTAELMQYFGDVIYEFPLERAIGEFLTPYYYHPHIVYLNDDEREGYYEISKQIARLWAVVGPEEGNAAGPLKTLLFKRARLIANASGKIPALLKVMEGKRDTTHNIFYCGSGSDNDETRQLEQVLAALGHGLGLRVRRFTADEDIRTRTEILHSFELGVLQGIVAIRCLDEGVDVPATRRAFILASSRNPREFVQRRGRVLRKYPGKDFAEIHDFVVVPHEPREIKRLDNEVLAMERNLLRGELTRASEFAETAINGGEAMATLLPVKRAYGLF